MAMEIKNSTNSTFDSSTLEDDNSTTTSTATSDTSLDNALIFIGEFIMGAVLGYIVICILGCAYVCYKEIFPEDDISVADAKPADAMIVIELEPALLVSEQPVDSPE